LSRDKKKLSVLVIGGGGYVFPRYIEKSWPGSRVDVAEIDPAVTEAATQAFGLERNTTINTFTMDARNYVNQLLEKERTEGQKTQYDFIYEDALNDYSIPYQLTTKEFNNKIAQLLTDSGVYMIELIDIYNSGLFVGAFINTLEQTFHYVSVVTEDGPRQGRNTFVILAAKQKINLKNLNKEQPVKNLDLWILTDSEIKTLKEKTRQTVLTDNFAPVENLLAPVARNSAAEFLSKKYFEQAKKLKDQQKWDESIEKYKDIIRTDPISSINAYNNIGAILAAQGKWDQAVDAFKSALEYNEKAKLNLGVSDIYFNIGSALKRLGRNEEASEYLQKAIQEYRKLLIKRPDSIKIITRMGNAFAENGSFPEATVYFQLAANMYPYDIKNHTTLVDALVIQQHYDEAIQALKSAIDSMTQSGDKENAEKLQQRLELVELKKFKESKAEK
jgi:tetratricopeptide (TPR) repeat protein